MKNFLKLNRLLVLFISVGYLVLAMDIYAEHFNGLSVKSVMWIPVVFGVIAFVLGVLVFVFFNKVSYYLFIILMGLSSIVGILGLYFHNKWRYPMIVEALLNPKSLDLGALVSFTPILAPSAFLAMAGLGILISFFEPWYKEESSSSEEQSVGRK